MLTWDDFFSLQRFGMTTGLDNIRLFVQHLDHPEKKFPSIHVAGTNGKGTVTAILDSVLRAAGLKVGRYTSPHISKFNERIHLNGSPIPDEMVFDFLETHWNLIQQQRFTFFETATAMAFQTFAEANIDIAVVEVGLGGTYDATRIVDSLITLFTSIDIDHTDRLGREVEMIARDKAGIMCPGVPAVTAAQHTAVLDVLLSTAREKATVLFKAEELVSFTSLQHTSEGITGSANLKNKLANVSVDLLLHGSFQIENLKAALAACTILMEQFPGLTQETIESGIHGTFWPGRLQVLNRDPLVILDVGHNPAALRAVLSEVKQLWKPRRIISIFAVMGNKDVSSMVKLLKENTELGILVPLTVERAMPVRSIARIAEEINWNITVTNTVSEGIEYAYKIAENGDIILIIGSHYLAEEVLKKKIYP